MKPVRRLAFALLSVLAVAGTSSEAPASKLYFLTYEFTTSPTGSSERFSLNRANLDGSGREEVLHDMGGQPDYASLVVYDGVVYWNTLGGGQTRAATTGGTSLGAVSPPNAWVSAALRDDVLDAAGEHVYFAGADPFGGASDVLRGDFEYEDAETLVETRHFSPNLSIALDESRGKVYWAGSWGGGPTGLLQRADLTDGGAVETLLEGFAEDDYTIDLAIDPAGGKLYWANNSFRKIQRANLDGTGLEDVLSDVWASSVALDLTPVPEPGSAVAFAGVFALAGAVLLRRPPSRRTLS